MLSRPDQESLLARHPTEGRWAIVKLQGAAASGLGCDEFSVLPTRPSLTSFACVESLCLLLLVSFPGVSTALEVEPSRLSPTGYHPGLTYGSDAEGSEIGPISAFLPRNPSRLPRILHDCDRLFRMSSRTGISMGSSGSVSDEEHWAGSYIQYKPRTPTSQRHSGLSSEHSGVQKQAQTLASPHLLENDRKLQATVPPECQQGPGLRQVSATSSSQAPSSDQGRKLPCGAAKTT